PFGFDDGLADPVLRPEVQLLEIGQAFCGRTLLATILEADGHRDRHARVAGPFDPDGAIECAGARDALRPGDAVEGAARGAHPRFKEPVEILAAFDLGDTLELTPPEALPRVFPQRPAVQLVERFFPDYRLERVEHRDTLSVHDGIVEVPL